jgi:fructokinase
MRQLLTSMGEILIDFLPIQTEGQTTGFTMHAGGAPYNVAVGMARLGQPTAFAGKVATDLFGRYLRGRVAGEGIDSRFLLDDPAASTLAFVSYEGGEPDYAFYGDDAADTRLTAAELPAALFDETAILHFGSISLLRGSTPAAVLATVERLKGHSLLSFDPNLRPGLVRDEAAYRALIDRLLGLADLVKVSAVDLAWLMPGQAPEVAAAALAARGPALVVVTQGGAGVLALRGAETLRVPAFRVGVVDTVGAGDSFSGGLLADLAAHGVISAEFLRALPAADLADRLRFASAVAAITCTHAGADPPRRAEVEEFLRSAAA